MKYHIFLMLTVFSLDYATSDKIDVLIVDGFSNHDWKQTTYVVKAILENSQLFNVATCLSSPDDENWKL